MHFLKRFFYFVVISLTISPTIAFADLRIVATIPDLANVAKAVTGDKAKVTALALPTQDPHFVDARPSLAVELARADALLLAGLDLEVGWLPSLQLGSRNTKIQLGARGYIDCSAFVQVLETHTAKPDRALGDIHPAGNPHYNYDPRAMALVAKGLAARFAELDPNNAAIYKTNAQTFAALLEQKAQQWQQELAALNGTNVIVYHKSFAYMANWLGFKEFATLEPKAGIPPTSAHIVAVLNQMATTPVALILQEAWYPSRIGEMVSQKTGVPLVKIAGGSNFTSGQSYIQHMEAVVKALAKALALNETQP